MCIIDNSTEQTDNILTVDQLNTTKGRKFVFLNVRSILPNINLLRAEFEHSNILLIGIWETWLTKRIHDNLIKIDGFNLTWYDRKQPKRGGGLLLYINDAIDYQPLWENLSSSDPDLEVLTAHITLPKQSNFLVSIVFIPPLADKAATLGKLK